MINSYVPTVVQVIGLTAAVVGLYLLAGVALTLLLGGATLGALGVVFEWDQRRRQAEGPGVRHLNRDRSA